MLRKTVSSLIVLGICSTPLVALAQHDDYHHDDHDQQRYVHHNEWRKGYHMRHEDWDRGERVDWHARHLHQPPRGYEWREVDGNYVMAAAATGIIASVIAASH